MVRNYPRKLINFNRMDLKSPHQTCVRSTGEMLVRRRRRLRQNWPRLSPVGWRKNLIRLKVLL